jgi:pantetheine-phosphate adenylyltransferase
VTRIGLFPASFDPIHLGHIDIAVRASRLFDDLVVAVYDRPMKNLLFSVQERVDLVAKSFEDVPNIRVTSYSGLTADYAREVGAQAIVRGLRVFSDFELEFRMALANNRLAPNIDTVCLITSEQHMHLASSTIREIASLGGDVSTMVPPHVQRSLLARFDKLGDDAAGAVDMVSMRD